jgi:hypothetical protein
VNRTKGTFGDATNPMDFLNALQQNVAAGIEEITRADQNMLRGIEEPERKELTSTSLFNQDLKQG